MKSILILAAAMAVVPLSTQAEPLADDCPGLVDGMVRPSAADEAYWRMAVAIMKAVQARDAAALASMVTPEANYSITSGDTILSSRQSGVEAMLDLGERFNPVSYQFEQPVYAPLGVVTDKCEWSVEMLILGEGEASGARLKFHFVDRILTRMTGSRATLLHGALR